MKYRATFRISEFHQIGWDTDSSTYEIKISADSKHEMQEKIRKTKEEYTKRSYGDFNIPLYTKDCELISVEEIETETVHVPAEHITSSKDVTKKFR